MVDIWEDRQRINIVWKVYSTNHETFIHMEKSYQCRMPSSQGQSRIKRRICFSTPKHSFRGVNKDYLPTNPSV